jgi:hypothetical protein
MVGEDRPEGAFQDERQQGGLRKRLVRGPWQFAVRPTPDRVRQDEHTMQSSNTHVVADHGGHYLYRQNAELVAEVIGHLVPRVRERDGQSGSAQGQGGAFLRGQFERLAGPAVVM